MKYFLLMIYNPLMLSYYNYIHNDMLKTASRVREIFSLMRCWGTLRQQIYRIRFSTLFVLQSGKYVSCIFQLY